MKLVYVLAASHSGSTLTALLIGAHPSACTVGELKLNAIGDVTQYICSCKKPVAECPFWGDIEKRMRGAGESFDISDPQMDFFYNRTGIINRLQRPLYRGRAFEHVRRLVLGFSQSWRVHTNDMHRRNEMLIRSIMGATGAEVIVDSSKIGSRLSFLLDNRALDIFVVRVVRDGRAVATTYMDPERFADARDPELRGGGRGQSRDAEILPMELAAREWRRSNEEAEAILRIVRSDRQTRIRYEDLCRKPLAELNRIYESLGLKALTAVPKFRSANPHVVGNGMRLDSSEEIVLDERWRDRLSTVELDKFDKVAGSLNRKLGYE